MTAATAGWISGLTSPVIQADMSSLGVAGQMSDSAAIQMLTDVANNGPVTAAEFNDLQTIASHLTLLASDYVISEFTQLVDGNPANAHWNGGSPTASPLGNLQIGTSSSQLNQLIGKWFLGSDLPDPTALGVFGNFVPTYLAFNVPLFGPSGVPSVNDIAQGAAGDCDLEAGLIDMVVNHPGLLQSMIVDNGNGTYGVRFYVNGADMWVTVNNQLPTQNGTLVYNHGYGGISTALWADLVEKAYAQLSATGEIQHPAINAYNNISLDPPTEVLKDLTGCSNATYYYATDSNWNSDKPLFISAIACHDDLILETYGTTISGLVNNHAIAIIGYDSATGDFIVRNSWGDSFANQDWNVQFEVSMADIASVDGDVAVDNAGSAPVSTANAIQNDQTLSSTINVLDSAANIFANLAGLQALMKAGSLQTVTLNDVTTPIESLGGAQYHNDKDVLSVIVGNYSLTVSGMSVADAVAIPTAVGSHLSSISVSDNLSNVASSLDALQSMATVGQLTSIALTDAGTPNLLITAAQSVSDSLALTDISGNFTVSINAASANATVTGVAGHANTVMFSGTAGEYDITPGGDGISLTVTDSGTGRASVDHLSDVSALQFSGLSVIVASQTAATPGTVSTAQITELYGAVFGRIPDVAGLAYYQAFAAAAPGTPFLQFAQWFLASPEYTGNQAHDYSPGATGDQQFITDCYGNLLHRTPSAAEMAFYESNLMVPATAGLTPGTPAYATADTAAHAQMLVYCSQSPEFLGDVMITAQTPASAQHWLLLI